MFDELLHQDELQPVKIGNVNGTSCTGNDGNPLRAIGNHALYDGAYEWTDGVAVYGNQKVNNGALPITAQKDGVPVLSFSMKGYIDKSARYHPYDIVSGAAITNSSKACISADASSLDSDVTNDAVPYAIYGDSYMWIAGNITETNHAFHYMDADGKPYNPNLNVKRHEFKTYHKGYDMSLKWHTNTDQYANDEKKFNYYDAIDTIFQSPFGVNGYEKDGVASIVTPNKKTSIPMKSYANMASNHLKNDLPKILDVIGRRKYQPSMMTPSFIVGGKTFWATSKSANAVNGKVFQDGTWWMIIKASASAKCIAWADAAENKIIHKQEHREYPDKITGGYWFAWFPNFIFDGQIVEEKHQITSNPTMVSRYGIADIGLDEYILVDSSGKSSRLYTTYNTPDKRSGFVLEDVRHEYVTRSYKDYSKMGVLIKSESSTGSYMTKNIVGQTVVMLPSVPSLGKGISSVPIGDGFRTVSDFDGSRHEVYDADGNLITSAVPFSATDNISACYLSTHTKVDGTKAARYLVGVHGKGIYLVENGTPTKLDDSLRNFRLRYMKPISRAKAKAKGES